MAAKKTAKHASETPEKVGAKTKKPSASPKSPSSKGGSESRSGVESKSPASQPAAKSKSKSSADKYADPALRDRLKDEIMQGDKAGKPGQWSARKAQLLASEYKKAGGEYKTNEAHKTEDQKHLDHWTDEDWQTADGKPADREGGTTRYLPAEAWDQLTPAQKRATNAKKQKGSESGNQFVANTAEAKKARKSATDHSAPKPKAAPKTPARQPAGATASTSPDEKSKAKTKGKAQPRPKAKKKTSE